ncbi:MAG TPA: hypothetical protein VMT53_18085 [Terriglobales bacterium]|nr:hypothetical protein [Terriglobales bacterium]
MFIGFEVVRDGDVGVERYGNSDVGVEREQRIVGYSLREWMVSEKTVCPSADDDYLGEPGIERLDQLG